MLNIIDTEEQKVVQDIGYNHVFNKKTGHSMRWGNTKEEDPQVAPAPELLDVEISTTIPLSDVEKYKNDPDYIVTSGGCNGRGCHFCYKGNNKHHHTLSTSISGYKKIIDKMPATICQIALGIMGIDSNPDLWKIMEYTRSKDIVPNITVNGIGITQEHIFKLKHFCGAVAVSVNEVNYTEAIGCIKSLLDIGLKQTNAHFVLHKGSFSFLSVLLRRLEKDCLTLRYPRPLNALVLLSGKDKQNVGLASCSLEEYKIILEDAQRLDVRLGFDSCGAGMYAKAISGTKDYNRSMEHCESCESGLMSLYINCHGQACVCSFAEGIEYHWNVKEISSFEQDIWHSKEMTLWRDKILGNGRNCPLYKIG